MANWDRDNEELPLVPALLDERETAKVLRVKAATVRAKRIRGKIAYIRIGARRFCTHQQISDYLEQQLVPACISKCSQHPGQIGSYWLSKRPGRTRVDDAWCRTWYDRWSRRTCRVSLGTSDFQETTLRLAAWVVANERPRQAAPDEVLVETILLNYWNDHARHLPSANTQRLGLSYWQEFWAGRTIADITPHEQRLFRDWVAKRGTGLSGIDRILPVGVQR
jgi:hypothetical protein